jgi:Lrp/AsnC family leucine-responsive transcriptional regulator
MAALVGAVERPHDAITLDETDIALLRALASDSRQSQRALAREVSMSAPAIAERLARFERLGVIRRYGVDIDWDRLGFDVVVYMPITLEAGKDLEPTLEAFRQIPELEELTVVTGHYDLLARFRLNDQAHLRELLLDRIWQIPNVLRIETMLSLGNLITDDFTTRTLDARRKPLEDAPS